MTVKELKAKLKGVPDDTLVVLSCDAEGNSYTEADDTSLMNYNDGKIGFKEITMELFGQGYTQEDVMLDGKPAIILWPE